MPPFNGSYASGDDSFLVFEFSYFLSYRILFLFDPLCSTVLRVPRFYGAFKGGLSYSVLWALPGGGILGFRPLLSQWAE